LEVSLCEWLSLELAAVEKERGIGLGKRGGPYAWEKTDNGLSKVYVNVNVNDFL